MRQLLLGRGANEDAHKGMTGNTMLIAQPSPSYEQVLPNVSNLTDSMAVLSCKSADDVSRAQVLVVNREAYRAMVHHRQQVCPVFASTAIDNQAISQLPEDAVPDFVMQSATHMPEASGIKTAIHGPASRVPIFCRESVDGGLSSDDHCNSSDEESAVETPARGSTGDSSPANNSSGDTHPVAPPGHR